MDELLPFFEGDFHENKVVEHFSLSEDDPNVQQEAIMGVPAYYQNDGSLLYLLTPAYSPPSVDSVCRWLACGCVGMRYNMQFKVHSLLAIFRFLV